MDRVKGGIIAAGHGERFQRAGILTPKALIPVAGKTLLERTIDQFMRASIHELTLIFNEQNAPVCMEFVRNRFPDLQADIIVKNTASSFESFSEVSARAGSGPLLITTIDSIYRPGALNESLEIAAGLSARSLVLGITSFIDDEKPLYVDIGPGGKILSLGGNEGKFATSGVYLIQGSQPDENKTYSALRYFLINLVKSGRPAYGFDMGRCVDVDRPEDLKSAEDLVSTFC